MSDYSSEYLKTQDIVLENGSICYKPKNLHPWSGDLKLTLKMLEGEIELPHAQLEIHNKICEECTQAFLLRHKYQLEKKNEEI